MAERVISIITGPTSSGKSELARTLGKDELSIYSVDQYYRKWKSVIVCIQKISESILAKENNNPVIVEGSHFLLIRVVVQFLDEIEKDNQKTEFRWIFVKPDILRSLKIIRYKSRKKQSLRYGIEKIVWVVISYLVYYKNIKKLTIVLKERHVTPEFRGGR